MLVSSTAWADFADDPGLHAHISQAYLPAFLQASRWFPGKSRQVTGLSVQRPIRLPAQPYYLATLLVEYTGQAESERFLLPLAFVTAPTAEPQPGQLGELTLAGQRGWLVDALSLIHI